MRVSIWNGSYITYADDTNIYWESTTDMINETINTANNVLDKVSNYCNNNMLRLNEGKCKFMILGSKNAIRKISEINLNNVTINNKNMERLHIARVLGVTMDEVLSWRKHVNLCIGKAMANFFQISRSSKFLEEKAKVNLCDSIVLSQFNYCDVVFSNMDKYLEQKIQKVQNLCIRFIFEIKKRHTCDYNSFRQKLNWLDMNKRRIKHGLTLIYKILHGYAPHYLSDSFTLTNEIHTVNTRNSSNSIWIDKSITSKIHRNSYRFHMAQIFNLLPENIKNSVSIDAFQNKLTKHLMDNELVLPQT